MWVLVRRSAKVVGVVSERLSKTLIRPLFSATKIRPSGENRKVMGLVSPLKTADSRKPDGRVGRPLPPWRKRRARKRGLTPR